VFQRGYRPGNGGPKGLDIDACSNILVVTSEYQPLAFFDVPLLLQHAFAGGSEREKRTLSISHELGLMQEIRMMAESVGESVVVANALRNTISGLQNTMSWRITAPLRRLKSIFRRLHRKRESQRDVIGCDASRGRLRR
jgi:hypothetical protein